MTLPRDVAEALTVYRALPYGMVLSVRPPLPTAAPNDLDAQMWRFRVKSVTATAEQQATHLMMDLSKEGPENFIVETLAMQLVKDSLKPGFGTPAVEDARKRLRAFGLEKQ